MVASYGKIHFDITMEINYDPKLSSTRYGSGSLQFKKVKLKI